MQHNTVILPDGKVLIIGGVENLPPETLGDLVHETEVFDPEETYTLNNTEYTGSFRLLDADVIGRRWYYHCSLLMPDGRVMVAGGLQLTHPNAGEDDEDDNPTIRFYKPWYFFHGTRPAITTTHGYPNYSTTASIVVDATTLVLESGETEVDIEHIVLMRNGTVANKVNPEQRLLELKITDQSLSGNTLTVTVAALPDNKDAPPGWYMMFVLDDRDHNGKTVRVPSEALWIDLQ